MWTVGESNSCHRNANAVHYHCANGPLALSIANKDVIKEELR